jgi:hypothetical protein
MSEEAVCGNAAKANGVVINRVKNEMWRVVISVLQMRLGLGEQDG